MLQSNITPSLHHQPPQQQHPPQPPPIADSVFWEHWMCLLATNLTPTQWQAYWQNYASMFGLNSLPLHLFSFFNNPNDPTNILLQNNSSSNHPQSLPQQQQIYRTESQQLVDHERCKF
uniref:Uncharacterized protein n=1 Tax=Panagrolaimus superbus TaxID=310955 RepID=A0A914Z221_9BILA